jgi:hypothetical protein
MSSSPSAPPAPDYTGAAKETAAGNLAAAQQATAANRVDTYTPYGNLTYAKDPNDPNRWSSTVSLSNSGQQLLDQQNKTSAGLGNLQDAATARVGGTLNSAMPSTYNANGVNAPQTYDANSSQLGTAYDPAQSTNNATDLINARLLPQQQRDSADLDNQLANQGIMPGSEAYTRAQDQMGRTQTDAKQQAALQGITLGQQQQAQTFGQMSSNAQQQQGMQGQAYTQQANNNTMSAAQQAQQYSQDSTNRNMPMNELNALRTGSQVTNPTFQQAPQQATTSGADMMGAATATNQYNMGLYNSQVGQQNSLLGAGASLGSAALMFSDARLKSDIRRIGTHDATGIGIYAYKKFGQPEIGVLAHELEAIAPAAVSLHETGFKMIDVGAL